jgi:hypothetical protein
MTAGQRYVYLEEYERCSCTQIEKRKKDLLGYCSRHFTDRKRVMKIPDIGEKGWVGNG